jgi:hypothetical protein
MIAMSERSMHQRMDDIEARLARLEGASDPTMIPPAFERLQQRLDERISARDLDPQVSPVGEVEPNVIIKSKAGTWGWSEEHITFERLLEADNDALAKGIAGLAHPVRIALAKALVDGPKESAELLAIAQLNTTGQLYHHLQAMADVGLVERRSRNLWASQNLGAFALLLFAGVVLADWRGPDDEGTVST